jgi:arabinose-5-phosphate isomerase
MEEIIRKAIKVVEIEQEALENLKRSFNEQFVLAVNIFRNAVECGKKIIIVGVGKSGNIGHKIAATLNSTGAPAVVLSLQNALHGDLGILCDGDVVLALSFSGETAELIELLPYIKMKDVKLVGLTGKEKSTLSEFADAVLLTPVEREACPLGLAPTSSSTAALVMGDALAMTLLDVRGFTEEDFAKYHPKGALGKVLLTRVKDIMRVGERIAVCNIEATVLETVRSMSKARSGACFIVDEGNILKGVFSHGDFARAYQHDEEIGRKPARDYMTPNPIQLHPQSLAAEAVKKIRDHLVDDVPVVDDQGVIIGVVDTQDFAKDKLI